MAAQGVRENLEEGKNVTRTKYFIPFFRDFFDFFFSGEEREEGIYEARS